MKGAPADRRRASITLLAVRCSTINSDEADLRAALNETRGIHATNMQLKGYFSWNELPGCNLSWKQRSTSN